MKTHHAILVLLLACPAIRAQAAPLIHHGLRVPAGFEVVEFADDKLANDIYTMTLDPRGRVVVAGRGYIRILVDDNNDGRADRAIDFADTPKDGAMGLLWEGDTLYVTGDGGLRRYHDADGDGKADGPSELIRALKTGGEHAAHAIRRGGRWLYVLCGNNTGIDRTYAQLPTSPIRDPVAGCVLRFTPDLKSSEIVADGFRNPYGMDFNADGELFTYDSDNERCVSLPWYEPTRFYHVIPGGHHGWQSPQRGQFWRLPPYLPDVVPPVTYLDRGSPTGLVCYREKQFPEHYRDGFFALDWTFGRIWLLRLTHWGATYKAEKEIFLQATGENGFAPTGAAVHPATGDLYVSVGGRGTRGAVYRIRYPEGLRAFRPDAVAALPPSGLRSDELARLRTLIDLRRQQDKADVKLTRNTVTANWDHSDRLVRKAAADLVALLPEAERQALGKVAQTARPQWVHALGSGPGSADVFDRALRATANPSDAPESRLAALRLVQLGLGGLADRRLFGTVWEGYSPRVAVDDVKRATATRALRAAFPSGDGDLDRELSRTLALFEDDAAGLPAHVLDKVTAASHPVEDLHYLIVLGRLRGERSPQITARTAAALLKLDTKLDAKHLTRDRHWPLRVGELYTELARKDAGLHAAVLAHPEFGRPDHVLFAQSPGFDRQRAAAIFLQRAEQDAEYPWGPGLVELLGSLPDERSLPVLRRLWDRGGLRESILPLLARTPRADDRERFLEGLTSAQITTVQLCLDTLEKLPPSSEPAHVLAVVRALRLLPDGKPEDALRARIGRYLRRLTGQDELGTDRDKWTDWFVRTHPELGAKLGGADGVDVAAWAKRLDALDWSAGNASRGGGVFVRAGCATCHSGGQALGPDLKGVAGRFSRRDLFTAILQPSKDVSPRYRTTLIATGDGRTHQGLVVYEAVDSLLLQTGQGTTVRLANPEIVERRVTPTSLMPAGLLDKLTDGDLADLYAYLRSLVASASATGGDEPPRPWSGLRILV